MKINSVRILNPFGEIWFGDTNNDSAIRHSTVRNKNLVFDVDCSPQICSIITVRICFKRGFTLSRAVKYLVKLERKLNDLLNSSIWKNSLLDDLIFISMCYNFTSKKSKHEKGLINRAQRIG